MEEVLDQLSSAQLSEPEAAAAPCSSYDTLFKNRGRIGSQEERRRWLLDSQKKQRNDKADHTRGILDLVSAVETEMEWSAGETGPKYKPMRHVAGFHRQTTSYRDTLMLSEWLVERPEDFSENWYLVPCPKGTRVLVVATAGRTKLFGKHGQFVAEGRSALAGGGRGGAGGGRCCVLDAVWHKERRTLHVLDLLAWNNQPMTNCDVEFRHYWLTGKLAECPELMVLSNKNQFVFSLLPKVPCSTDNINQFMMRHPTFPEDCPALDGLLLYHKRALYCGGSTPLVGWLYPYMVPEVLGADVTVHPKFIASAPPDYTTQAAFIADFDAKQSNRSQRPRVGSRTSCVSALSDKHKDNLSHLPLTQPAADHLNGTMEVELSQVSELPHGRRTEETEPRTADMKD